MRSAKTKRTEEKKEQKKAAGSRKQTHNHKNKRENARVSKINAFFSLFQTINANVCKINAFFGPFQAKCRNAGESVSTDQTECAHGSIVMIVNPNVCLRKADDNTEPWGKTNKQTKTKEM